MFVVSVGFTSDEDLRTWWAVRSAFQPFQEAICGDAVHHDDLIRARLDTMAEHFEPGMVLRAKSVTIDNAYDELWLESPKVGYWGTGPFSTALILSEEGFPDAFVDLVPHYNGIRLVKGQNSPEVFGFSDAGHFDFTMSEKIRHARSNGGFDDIKSPRFVDTLSGE